MGYFRCLTFYLYCLQRIFAKYVFCPAKVCSGYPNEIERWECIGRFLYSPNQANSVLQFVQHDCWGVGWGNSIRGLISSSAVALILGRRLIIFYPVFNRMFLPPDDNVSNWDFGMSTIYPQLSSGEVSGHFNYAKHGIKFNEWATNLSTTPVPAESSYDNMRVVSGGVCAGEVSFITDGNCVASALPVYGKCVRNIMMNVAGIPFFYLLFRRPSSIMANIINRIRTRLELPSLEKGLEAHPGAWALRTPGFYIFALHFRNVPIGFEPSSFEVQDAYKKMKGYRSELFKGYWIVAEKAAKKALDIANCRGQKLLIYFASDDAQRLRKIAQQKLSKYGRVVFGLNVEEVGHMIPNQWTKKDLDKLEEMKRNKVSEIIHVDKSDKASEMHGNMAMAEWWILANSNWLLSHSGTSFSETAATFGLGPSGVMERFDFLHQKESYSTQFRIDWMNNNCDILRAADKLHANTCPNTND